MEKSATRESNIELLRIVVMLFVLIQHANFLGVGAPSQEACAGSPLDSFVRFLIQGLTIVAVNVFVIISGWFGIKPSLEKLLSFLFQVFFFTLGIPVVYGLFTGWDHISASTIIKGLLITKGFWFIKSYMLLFILSPVLNSFSEKASKREFLTVILGFLAFQTIYGWSDSAPEFAYGYSTLSFAWLYLTARFLRKFPLKISHSRGICLCIYLTSALLVAMMAYVVARWEIYPKHGMSLVFSYINPLITLGAFALFFTFENIKGFRSSFVNWVAVSSLAVYVIHTSSIVWHPYLDTVWRIYDNSSPGIRPILIMGFLIAIFLVCILLDKFRIVCWNKLKKLFVKK